MNPNMKSHFKRWQTLFIFEHNTFAFYHALQIYGNAPVDICCFKRLATSYSARRKITSELRDTVKMKARVEN